MAEMHMGNIKYIHLRRMNHRRDIQRKLHIDILKLNHTETI